MTRKGGILAPGLVDPHLHIESSMVTACAYAEAALLNGTTTIFCDSHEIGNVMDVAGVEAMLEDARQAPLSIYPHRAQHRAGHLGGARDRRRRPDGRQDRRTVRPLARGGGARREDGFRAGRDGRRAEPRHPGRRPQARPAGLRPCLRARIRGRLCGQRRDRYARGDRPRDRRRSSRRRRLDLPARRAADHALALAARGHPHHHRARGLAQARRALHRRPGCRRSPDVRARLGGARGGPVRHEARAGLGHGLAAWRDTLRPRGRDRRPRAAGAGPTSC